MIVRYSRRALAQLASVYDFLSYRNPSAADSVADSIRSTIERLSELPLLGKGTDEKGVHVIIEPEYRYRVFYRIENQIVLVIRIFHGRQK